MAPECDGYEYGSAMKMILVLLLGYLTVLLLRTVDAILGKRPGDPITVSIILVYIAEKGLALLKSQHRLHLHLASARNYQLAFLNFGVLICYVLSLRLQSLKKSFFLDLLSSTILIVNKAANSFPPPPTFVVQNYIIISLAIVNWAVLLMRSYLVPSLQDPNRHFLPQIRREAVEDVGLGTGLREGGDEENVRGAGPRVDTIIDWLVQLATLIHVTSWLSKSNRSWLDFTSHTCSLLATGVLVEAVAESFLFPEELGFHICESNGFLYSQLLLPFLLVVTLSFFSIILFRWSVPLYMWLSKKKNKSYRVAVAGVVLEKADDDAAGGGASRPDLKHFASDAARGGASRPDLKRFTADLVDRDKDRNVVQMAMHRTYDKFIKEVTEPEHYDRPRNLIRLLGSSSSSLIKMAPDFHDPARDNELPMCWTLRVFTLKSIAIALPLPGSSTSRSSSKVNNLLRGVSEGLYYAKLVDELDLLLQFPDPVLLKMKEAAFLDSPPLLKWSYSQRHRLHRWLNTRRAPFPPPTTNDRWLGFDIRRIQQEAKTAEEALTRLRTLARDASKAFNASSASSPSRMDTVSWRPRDFAAYSMYTTCQELLHHLRKHGHHLTAAEATFQQVEDQITDAFRHCINNYPRLAADKLSSTSSKFYPSQRSIGRVLSTLAGTSKLRDTEWVKAESRRSNRPGN